MKYMSVFIIAIACQFNLNAQKITESAVPTAVKTSYTQMFNNIPVTGWELENGNYEASYMQGGVSSAVLYASDGKLIQLEYAIGLGDMPEAALTYMRTNVPDKKLGDMTRIKTVTGSISYEIETSGGDYLFDTNGNYISMEPETDDND